MEIDQHNQNDVDNVAYEEAASSLCHPVSLSPGHPVRRLWPWMIWAGVLLGVAFGLGVAQAQGSSPARAGIVIQLALDRVISACVSLGDDGTATGEEMLRAAVVQLPLVIEYTPGIGGAVCKIDNQGCDFPTATCFCECTLTPGSTCNYWAYNQLINGQWRYASQGSTSSVVHNGDVEGWAWGAGTVSNGAQPPVKTFDELCAQQQIAPTITTAPATDTTVATRPPTAVPPTASKTATAIPRIAYLPIVEQQVAPVATATVPTFTPTATQTAVAQGVVVTATPQATATPQRIASVTLAPPPQSQASPLLAASATPARVTNTESPVPSASIAPIAQNIAPTQTASVAGPPTEATALPNGSFASVVSPTLAASSTTMVEDRTPAVVAEAEEPAKSAPTVRAPQAPGDQPASSTGGAVQKQPEATSKAQTGGYVVFAVLVLALAGGWIYFQRRQRQ